MPSPHNHRAGIVRREFMQVGFSAFLGLGVSQWGTAGEARTGRARSVILVFLTGGPSHIDTIDPKPDAPAEIRGEYATIATRAPGVCFTEHLPMLADRADRLAVVRSLSHQHANHLNGTHQVLTGHPQPGAFFDKIASRDDHPCYGSAVQYLRPPADGVPAGVMLPTFLMEGPLVWPGQHAGFLGPKFDPWQIKGDPNDRAFRVEEVSLPEGFSIERLERRRSLADELARQRDSLLRASEQDPFGKQREKAYSLLLSGKVSSAFELDRERDETRERYGRHTFGQSLLLARRLVEAGVPVVQVNMGRVQTWDSHSDVFRRLKQDLLPPTDRGVSALLDDLEARGLLDETLVVVAGEFGRTPRLSQLRPGEIPGRDHWPAVFSALFAGAGVRGGQVIGASDRVGAYPATRPIGTGDFAATIYEALGVKGHVELRDRLGRPNPLVVGRPISALYDGLPT